MKKLALLFVLLAVSVQAQTIAVQRAAHNFAVCASVDKPSSCTDADVIAVVCTALFPSNPGCADVRPHSQIIYSADAAFRNADDTEHQKVRLLREKDAVASRVSRRALNVLQLGGSNCVSLLTALGFSDTSVCGR